MYYLLKELANKKSPFSKFSIGSTDSLNSTLFNASMLENFVKTYYVPSNMQLVVYTSESEKERARTNIQRIFNQIPSRKAPEFRASVPVYLKEQKGRFVKLLDSSDVDELTLAFVVQQNADKPKSRSVSFVLYQLIVGQPNYCDQLKKEMLVSGCDISAMSVTEKESIVFVQMTLVSRARYQVADLVQRFYIYLKSTKINGLQRENYEYLSAKAKVFFKYKEQSDLFDTIESLGLQFLHSPNENVLFQGYDFSNYDQQEVYDIAEQMVPQNSFIVLRSNDFSRFHQADKVFPGIAQFLSQEAGYTDSRLWDMKYAIYQLTEQDCKELVNVPSIHIQFSTAFTLPDYFKMQNPLSDTRGYSPDLLISNNKANLWFYQDASFHTPYEFFSVYLDNPMVHGSAEYSNYAQILSLYINWYLQYPLSYVTKGGIVLQFYFFSDYTAYFMDHFVQSVMQQIGWLSDDEIDYLVEVHQSNLFQSREDFILRSAMSELRQVLAESEFTTEQMLEQLKSFSNEKFSTWLSQYLNYLHLEVLIAGNVKRDDALKSYRSIRKQFRFQNVNAMDYPLKTLRNITSRDSVFTIRHPHTGYDHYNRAVVNYYQIGALGSKEDRIIASLINPYFQAYAFQYLRSELQIGYIVGSRIMKSEGVYGLAVYVEGYRFSVDQCNKDIEQFLSFMYDVLNRKLPDVIDLSPSQDNEKIPEQKRFVSLSQEVTSIWSHIITEKYFKDKNHTKHENRTVQRITKAQVLDRYQLWFKDTKAKLSLQLTNPTQDQVVPNTVLNKNDIYCGAQEILFPSLKSFNENSNLNNTNYELKHRFPIIGQKEEN